MFWRRKLIIIAPLNHGIKQVDIPKGYVLLPCTDPDRVRIH